MVQTRSAAKNIESGQAHQDSRARQEKSVVDHLDDVVPPLAKKPRKKDVAVPKERRLRAKPSELCRLNLDVLFLIAAYIHPVDLLNLARTCKSLRELLMDQSSKFVWKSTFGHVKGLPPCPTDLTEPEYANLVFYARCHGCGKYTTTILWNVRRRYCPGCRIRRLRRLTSCNAIIRENNVLPAEYITVKKESSIRVDRDQAASFMHDYNQSSDKKQFLVETRKQSRSIFEHASECEIWQKRRDLERKRDWKTHQRERCQSMFRRLEQHYPRQINYFGRHQIQRARESDFRTSKPLTDKEWQKIRPEWDKIMDDFRLRLLECEVYRPRRRDFLFAYNRYVKHQSPGTPTFELPHVVDLANFPPFREILDAPEKTRVDGESFESAFAQLPGLVREWKKQIDTELAELVKIYFRVSKHASGSRPPASLGTASSVDKLRLACAVFQTTHPGVFTHPDVFSASMLGRSTWSFESGYEDNSESPGSMSDRFGIKFLEEAPYVIHACGLDPNVATADDMDHRNARLSCLACKGRALIIDWRRAMLHACTFHQGPCTLAHLSKAPRWRLVGDEHIDAIQDIEQSIMGNTSPSAVRCLLCRPCVGDIIKDMNAFEYHLYQCHGLDRRSYQCEQGKHYAPVGLCNSPSVAVEMVEEGGRVTFKETKVITDSE